jgi:hypothetical protein
MIPTILIFSIMSVALVYSILWALEKDEEGILFPSIYARMCEIFKEGVKRMPFKSEAQRKKFIQLQKEGKISSEVFNKWEKETGKKKLPERTKAQRPKK